MKLFTILRSNLLKLIEFIKKMSLKTKIIVLIILAIIPVILSGMINFYSNRYFMTEYFSVHENLLTIDTIINDTVNILPIVREYVSDPYMKDNRVKFEKLKKEIQKSKAEIIINDEEDNKLKHFLEDVSLYINLCEKIMDMAEQNVQSVRNDYSMINFQADNVKRSAIDLTMQELNYGNSVRKEINKKLWDTYFISSVIVAILISIVFIMISLVMKRVISGLKKLEDLSLKVTHREYDLTLVEIKGNDEIGLLARAFNEMVLSLKSAYHEIDKRQRELQCLNGDLTSTNKQLLKTNEELKNTQEQMIQSEKLASLGGLVAGVAHEINTPIGVSVTAASFLKDKNNEMINKIKSNQLRKKEFENYSDSIIEASDILLSNLQRASELIGSFKMIAVDQTNEESREINLNEYIEDVILSLKHVLKKTSIEINLESEEKGLKYNTYPGSLAQVLTNLIMNSVIHGFDNAMKGKITIATYKIDNIISIKYIDDGKGMDGEALKKMFEPFYTTKRGQGGSGLGMFIVYNIVNKRLKGSIECESSLGKGVTFTIKIPV